MITAEESLAYNKKCVEDIKANGGEYYDKYMTMFENAIKEANEKYGSTYARLQLDNVEFPWDLQHILAEAMNFLGYYIEFSEFYKTSGHFCTDIRISWNEAAIKQVREWQKKREQEDGKEDVNSENA